MRAFGREVAVKTLTSVLATSIAAALAAVFGAAKLLAPQLVARYQLTFREAVAWASVAALASVVVVLSVYVASL